MSKSAVFIIASRNYEGQTAQAAQAVFQTLQNHGFLLERYFLPELHLERCRQCEDSGWGDCRREGSCIIHDEFTKVVEKLRTADFAVFATPVYYGDLSESMRAFTDRLRRICTHADGKQGIENMPAIGICVAGGGGGGAPECCVSLKKVLRTCGFDMLDMIPARRQNLAMKLELLEQEAEWLVENL